MNFLQNIYDSVDKYIAGNSSFIFCSFISTTNENFIFCNITRANFHSQWDALFNILPGFFTAPDVTGIDFDNDGVTVEFL